jgi:excinuclease ABC subunit A
MILAPVVADRKGEQLDLFADLRAQGFVRVRVDGTVPTSTPAQAGQEAEAHHRGGGRPRSRCARRAQRLAESFETALMHAEGRAIAVEMDTGQGTPVLGRVRLPGLRLRAAPSSSRACSRSTTRWAPARSATASARSSSSTRARGRHPAAVAGRPARSGLGPAQPVLFSRCWSRWPRTTASTSTRPSRSCRTPSANIVLYGSGKDRSFRYLNDNGTRFERAPFEGIIPNLERRYRETDSWRCARSSRSTGNNKPCPACTARACAARRATCFGRRRTAASEVSRLPLRDAGLLRPAARRPARPRSAEKILKEIAAACLPDQRRPRLPVARPQRRHALRRRGAAHPPGRARSAPA